jgi:hypothetical protein
MSLAYYNEYDSYAAHWLRNLIAAGHIAPGVVDTRDIRDIDPSDLKGFTQVHMFAGVGVWSYALRQAGWSDSREIWTGSCPCQPFSAAGRGRSFSDERHLWPAFRKLIATCKPPIVLGEQVASKVALEWFDEVAWDLENISLWESFYENLHAVQAAAAIGKLPDVFRQIAGWSPASLQAVPTGIRKDLAVAQSGVPGGSTQKTPGEGQDLFGRLPLPESGSFAGEGVCSSVDTEEPCVRSRVVSAPNRSASPKGRLRNDGRSSRNCAGSAPLEFPVDRSDNSGIRVYLREYTHRLFCDECRLRELGRTIPSRNDEGMVRERLADDERGLTEAFEGFLASKDGLGWFDLVSADLEGTGYAVGASDLCAAGIGVDWQDSQSGEWLRRAIHDCVDPVVRSMLCDFADWAGEGNISEGGNHIRQRLYFVGLADSDGRDARAERQQSGGQYGQQPADCGAVERLADPMHAGRPERGTGAGGGPTAGLRATGGMDDDDDARSQGHSGNGGAARREGSGRPIAAPGVSVGLADDLGKQRSERAAGGDDAGRRIEESTTLAGLRGDIGTDAPDGRRYAKDWLFCRDGKWRAARSGSFPLSYGASARVGRLRAYGNALDAETATRFCETVKEICDG